MFLDFTEGIVSGIYVAQVANLLSSAATSLETGFSDMLQAGVNQQSDFLR